MTNNDYTFELSIADAIETQIKTLDPYAFWAWGVKDLTTIIDNDGIDNVLRFKTS